MTSDNRKKWERVREEMADHWVDEGWGLGKPIDEQHCWDSFVGGFDAATKYWRKRAEKLVEALRKIRSGDGCDGDTMKCLCDLIAHESLKEWEKE